MEREEIKKKIVNLEVELDCWKKKLDEPTVELKLANGTVMEIPERKIVKLRNSELNEVRIKSEEGEQVAWIADVVNAQLVIHLSDDDFNYHLGRDYSGLALVATKKHDC